MIDDSLLVEGLHSQTDVINVSAFASGAFAPDPAELSIDGDEIDHRCSYSYVDQSKLWPAPFGFAAEYAFVEPDARLKVSDTKDNVIDALN